MAFELAIVGVATIALLVPGAPAMAAVLAVLVAMSTALLLRFDWPERATGKRCCFARGGERSWSTPRLPVASTQSRPGSRR
jgi:hypothetical protein